MTIYKCKECGKELPNGKFPTCRECYLKKTKGVEEEPSLFGNEQEEKQNEKLTFFDTKKKYLMPGWFLLIVFLLGVLVGAWLW